MGKNGEKINTSGPDILYIRVVSNINTFSLECKIRLSIINHVKQFRSKYALYLEYYS